MKSLPANSRRPQIILAFDWWDERFFKGIVRFATEAKWHLSPYFFSDRWVPMNWPGDGAITCYGRHMAKFIQSLDMPMVDITILPIEREIPRVTVDDEAIGRMAADHFLGRGYRNFAYYSWPSVPVNVMRGRAFFRRLREAGVEEGCLYTIRQSPARSLKDWQKHAAHILEQVRSLPRPLAVFTGQDNLGATLIEICQQNDIHVPEEVAVLGVDNIEFLCDSLAVPLSSIETNLDKVGYEAASRLQQLMDGAIGMDAEPILIAPQEVVTRMSSDVLAIPHGAVVKAMRFITEHFGDPITLEDIADHVGMSKRGMERAFLKHLGRSPAEELRRLRLDHAKQMLTEGDEKIETIARACGYSNSSNLSFAFNREAGMSPRAYRKKFRA